jgi:hypothetical protein
VKQSALVAIAALALTLANCSDDAPKASTPAPSTATAEVGPAVCNGEA